jgi:hypothetical protein
LESPQSKCRSELMTRCRLLPLATLDITTPDSFETVICAEYPPWQDFLNIRPRQQGSDRSPDERQWPSALLGCRSRQGRQQPSPPVEEVIHGPTNRGHGRNTRADLHPGVHRSLIRPAQIPTLRLATAMTTLKRQPLGSPQKHVVMPNEKAPQRPHLNKSFRGDQNFSLRGLDRPGTRHIYLAPFRVSR